MPKEKGVKKKSILKNKSPRTKYFPGEIFGTALIFSRVFELPLPRNAQKRTKKRKKKKEGTCVLFLRAGADVRRFYRVFFPAAPCAAPPRHHLSLHANKKLHKLPSKQLTTSNNGSDICIGAGRVLLNHGFTSVQR
jgi:hypothetical protein